MGLKKLLKAANENIALYADISLIVQASDTGEYLGSLHKTDEPIKLALAYDVNEVAVDNDDNVTPPDTGDANNTELWLVLMGLQPQWF